MTKKQKPEHGKGNNSITLEQGTPLAPSKRGR